MLLIPKRYPSRTLANAKLHAFDGFPIGFARGSGNCRACRRVVCAQTAGSGSGIAVHQYIAKPSVFGTRRVWLIPFVGIGPLPVSDCAHAIRPCCRFSKYLFIDPNRPIDSRCVHRIWLSRWQSLWRIELADGTACHDFGHTHGGSA